MIVLTPPPDVAQLREMAKQCMSDADQAISRGDFVSARDHAAMGQEAMRRLFEMEKVRIEVNG